MEVEAEGIGGWGCCRKSVIVLMAIHFRTVDSEWRSDVEKGRG